MSNTKTRKALVLLSGGLDSSTCLAVAKQTYNCTAVGFNYNQRHLVELLKASQQAKSQNVPFKLLRLPLYTRSSLTDHQISVNQRSQFARDKRLPSTFTAGRNLIFLSHMLAYGYPQGIKHYFIGVNNVDYSGYPDCKPEFIQNVTNTLRLAVDDPGIYVHTPLISYQKAAIIKLGRSLNVDYSETWSCYNPQAINKGEPLACGKCESCRIRLKGFREANLQDPIKYVT